MHASCYFSDPDEENLLKGPRVSVKAYKTIKPETEPLLAAQMVGNYFTVIKCYQRAAICEQPPEWTCFVKMESDLYI